MEKSGPRAGWTTPEAGTGVQQPSGGPDLLGPLLEGCLTAVAEETAAVREELVRRGLDRPLPGTGGRAVSSTNPGHRYEWDLPSGPLRIRPEDGVRVRTSAGETLGFVSAYDPAASVVRVVVQDSLGQAPGPAELEFDPTWLLASLASRLEAIRERPERWYPDTVLRLFGRRFPELGHAPARLQASAALNPDQGAALGRILGSQAHFVWGPPGTGKTRLLGHAAAELARAGPVLVTATTNGAVDEAAARTAQALGSEAVEANRIIRSGAGHVSTADPRLSLAAAVERRVAAGAGGVLRELEALERELGVRRTRGSGYGAAPAGRPWESGGGAGAAAGLGPRTRMARLAAAAREARDDEARRRLQRLAGELQKQAVLALRDADVVLSTLAGLAVRDELAALRFRSLVLDEASTAPLPHVALAAAMASETAVAIGDFQQLPSVVVSRAEAARRWMDRDIFREAGVVADPGELPPGEIPLPAEHDRLCAMLRCQYRMAPPVRALVSELFYGGRLTDAPEVAARPGPAAPLVFLETGSLDPAVEREEGSRANAAHAEAVVAFLQAAAAAGVEDVAVVTPYRLQSRRVWRLARRRLGRAAPRQLEISTIHRFQGREKSVLVFDTVDAPPGRSWFLHEGRNRDFPRLLNVALSRTRDMLVVVGTAEGLRHTLPEEALLNRVVERVRQSGTVIDARQLPARAASLFAPGASGGLSSPQARGRRPHRM